MKGCKILCGTLGFIVFGAIPKMNFRTYDRFCRQHRTLSGRCQEILPKPWYSDVSRNKSEFYHRELKEF